MPARAATRIAGTERLAEPGLGILRCRTSSGDDLTSPEVGIARPLPTRFTRICSTRTTTERFVFFRQARAIMFRWTSTPDDQRGVSAYFGDDRRTIIATKDGPDRRDRHSRASRQPALEPVSYAGRDRPRNHLDTGRAGGDARRRAVRRAQGQPDASLHQPRYRSRQQRLSCRRRARGAGLWLADGSDRAQEAFFRHTDALSGRDGGDRAVMGCRQLRAVPVSHGRRHRRRIYRDQFDDSGTGAGALPRMDRPDHQRQFLDRCRPRCGRRDRAARSASDRSRTGMAACVPDRRRVGTCGGCDAAMDSGKPALADDSRPAGSGSPHRGRHRTDGGSPFGCAR